MSCGQGWKKADYLDPFQTDFVGFRIEVSLADLMDCLSVSEELVILIFSTDFNVIDHAILPGYLKDFKIRGGIALSSSISVLQGGVCFK